MVHLRCHFRDQRTNGSIRSLEIDSQDRQPAQIARKQVVGTPEDGQSCPQHDYEKVRIEGVSASSGLKLSGGEKPVPKATTHA